MLKVQLSTESVCQHGTSAHVNVIRKGKHKLLGDDYWASSVPIDPTKKDSTCSCFCWCSCWWRLGCSPVLFCRGEGLAAVLLDPAKIMWRIQRCRSEFELCDRKVSPTPFMEAFATMTHSGSTTKKNMTLCPRVEQLSSCIPNLRQYLGLLGITEGCSSSCVQLCKRCSDQTDQIGHIIQQPSHFVVHLKDDFLICILLIYIYMLLSLSWILRNQWWKGRLH